MFLVGELNDSHMASVILEEYSAREIRGHYYFDKEKNSYVIAVEEQENVLVALDIYRVKLGFKKPIEIDEEWVKIKSVPKGSLSIKIVVFCVLLLLFSYFESGPAIYKLLQIDSNEIGFLSDFFHGQIWRIITPIFLHMGFIHLLFNMLWFLDIGSIIEFKYSKKYLIAFVFISGVVSNLFQYAFKGPSFGGMSGVIYAMLGFIWINKKINTSFEYSLPKHDIFMMIGWFFLCLFGIFPNVANYAHAGGLAIGIWWATLTNFEATMKRVQYLSYGIFVVLITVLIEKFNFHF